MTARDEGGPDGSGTVEGTLVEDTGILALRWIQSKATARRR